MDWAALALSEICFSAPVNRASDSDPASLRTLLLSGWVRPQIRYQRAVYQRMERNHRLLARVGLGLFLLSLLAAVLHAVDARRDETAPEYWAYVSIVVPALAAAITGYAAQREHLRAAKRADKTARDLERAERDLADVTTHEGLRDVASRIDVMLQGESADWYSLATTHNLELP
jgi:O-antigen/teichoic acid export membrane protein